MLMFQPLNAKVEAPNYDFSLDTLSDFFPDKELSVIVAKYGEGEKMGREGEMETIKFMVSQIRYKFPVLVQIREGKVQDFFARLPSYFLHDLFFQSLVNRYGKQKSYKRVGEEAFYVWERDGLVHVYSAACTITCFPIFYSVKKAESGPSILEKMKKVN